MSEFVVLHHETNPNQDRESHWDLMLEDAGTLLTWALPQPPRFGDKPQACQKLADHRTAYLRYEGPVSGDRGSVTCWDRGTFIWKSRTPTEIQVVLSGKKLSALLVLALQDQTWACIVVPPEKEA